MDVELFRPGTVPISPDTILWFEFLLDPNLLKNHLAKPSPDPSATDLMIKLSSIAPAPEPAEEAADTPQRHTRKHLALKILCLKVAAHLKWNLSMLESALPPNIQSQLMQDLLYMATDGLYSLPPTEVSAEELGRGGVCFSLVLYHRWLLRFLVNRALLTRSSKQEGLTMGVMSTETGYMQISPNFDKLVRQCEEFRKQSILFLTDLAQAKANMLSKISGKAPTLKVPTLDTFVTLTEDMSDMTHDWDNGNVIISEHEFYMQVNYDLCSNFFFYGQYEQAKQHILLSNDHKESLIKEGGFSWDSMDYASVTEAEIFGYMKALNISQERKTLMHDLHDSVSDNYTGIVQVLQADNLRKEIPLVHRHVVESDIQGSSSSGVLTVSRDLLNKVVALNVVRSVLDGNLPSTYVDFNSRMRTMGPIFIENLYWAFTPVLLAENLPKTDLQLIKHFFLHLATSEHNVPLHHINTYIKNYPAEEHPTRRKVFQLFEDAEIEELNRDLGINQMSELPTELLSTDWDTPDFNICSIPALEVGCLRQRLIDAMTADKIRECLVNLAITNPAQPLWTVNPQWKLPIPLQSVIMSLPRGFLQDFSYILLGKARQQAEMGDHSAALELLLILETETRNQLNQSAGANALHTIIYKLCKLVGWEALLMQITQMLADWPNHVANMSVLMGKCNMCIMAVQSGDTVIPRLEIVEMCSICLLNGGKWDTLTETQARGSGAAEAAAATALACAHLHRQPKLPKDLWEMVVPIFATNFPNSNKRNNSGNQVHQGNREGQHNNSKMRDGMTSFFCKLRDPTVLSVVISLLARLFNVLKDDSNVDLNMEYVNLWPSVVSNSNLYSIKSVSETLHRLVSQALKYYPDNISWIKLMGDMSLVGGHFSTAMKHYLSALTIMSDNFVQPVSKQLVEDQTIFKRMIKCCTQLNCPTQAAILCQFLDETDYVLAFKCLAEMSQLCSDAMDSYYGCIWDTSILEYLINLHHKRGETHRKQLAVKVMGMLELNSNNNEEIQREAANSRKAKFMRALVRQYVC